MFPWPLSVRNRLVTPDTLLAWRRDNPGQPPSRQPPDRVRHLVDLGEEQHAGEATRPHRSDDVQPHHPAVRGGEIFGLITSNNHRLTSSGLISEQISVYHLRVRLADTRGRSVQVGPACADSRRITLACPSLPFVALGCIRAMTPIHHCIVPPSAGSVTR
jgi:hypothetical protein